MITYKRRAGERRVSAIISLWQSLSAVVRSNQSSNACRFEVWEANGTDPALSLSGKSHFD